MSKLTLTEEFELFEFRKRLVTSLERIATTQEKLLAIAEQSQKERNELSDKMKQAFKVQGVQADK